MRKAMPEKAEHHATDFVKTAGTSCKVRGNKAVNHTTDCSSVDFQVH